VPEEYNEKAHQFLLDQMPERYILLWLYYRDEMVFNDCGGRLHFVANTNKLRSTFSIRFSKLPKYNLLQDKKYLIFLMRCIMQSLNLNLGISLIYTYICLMKKKQQEIIAIDDILVSGDITEDMFACDIARCKGACCVEGDVGAPLEDEELEILEEIYHKVKPYLSKAGKRAILDQGTSVLDFTGEYTTPLVEGKECAYTVFDEKGVASCGIEQAYNDGVIEFRKPVSCHLYPIRVTKKKNLEALNYDRWDICSPACELGKQTRVKVYEFTKAAIIRKYGQLFYDQLDQLVKFRETTHSQRT